MSYRLGVDVGGTFTDLLLINEKTGTKWTAKVPSTPEDSSIGVFNGINLVCKNAKIDQSKIPENEHKELFYNIPGSYGSFGIITFIKLKLEKSSKYIKEWVQSKISEAKNKEE